MDSEFDVRLNSVRLQLGLNRFRTGFNQVVKGFVLLMVELNQLNATTTEVHFFIDLSCAATLSGGLL